MRWRSIGVRLAAWYLAVLALSLGVCGAGMWVAMRHSLMQDVEIDLSGHLSGLHRGLTNWSEDEPVETAVKEYASGLTKGYLLRLRDQQGRVLFASPDFESAPAPSATGMRTIRLGPVPVRTLTENWEIRGRRYQVELGASLDFIEDTLSRFRSILLSLVPAVFLLAMLGGWWLSRRALRPVDELIETARSVSVHSLGARLAVPQTGDELQRLSETLNDMLERLDGSVRRITQFTADASHELRTPLALVHTAAELALRRERSTPEYQAALRQILDDSERTTRLLEDLLLLARADAGKSAFHMVPLDLGETVEDVCRQMRVIADQKHLAFRCQSPEVPAEMQGDPGAVRRLVLALVDNALKYTPSGGRVDVTLQTADGQAILEVKDTGKGIEEADLPHIFDRFYRADKVRGSEGGAGLGLAIAQEIVHAHGAEIEVESVPQQGSCFRVRLRLSPIGVHRRASAVPY